MTTWHDSEPLLSEALCFFLVSSIPEEHYLDQPARGMAVSVGSSAWAAEIAEALDDPQQFMRRGTASGTA